MTTSIKPGVSKKSNRFSPEVKDRAVRLMQDNRNAYPSQWAAIESIAPKIGCSADTLLQWANATGMRQGLTSDERAHIKALERENRELRRANEILKLAIAFFAQAQLDRKLK